ncbi:MAG: Ig-like domain-containing protein [Caloramator sp.]|nr:Ig-like domain-containing protein [Caloramator sp.]
MKKFSLSILLFLIMIFNITYADNNYDKYISNVPLDKVWTLNFSTKVDLKNSPQDSIKVTDEYGNKIYTEICYGNTEKTILIKPPSGGYSFNKKYYLKVDSNLKSKYGKSIKNPYTLLFNTINEYTGTYDVQIGALAVLKTITIKQTSTKATKFRIDESYNFYKIGEAVRMIITKDTTNVYFYGDDGTYKGKATISVKENCTDKTFKIN